MKYLLIFLFMIPCISIKAGPQTTAVTVGAGVVSNTLNVDDFVTDEPVTDPLISSDIASHNLKMHGICDTACQKSEPKQINYTPPTTVIDNTSKIINTGELVKTLTTETGCIPTK